MVRGRERIGEKGEKEGNTTTSRKELGGRGARRSIRANNRVQLRILTNEPILTQTGEIDSSSLISPLEGDIMMNRNNLSAFAIYFNCN